MEMRSWEGTDSFFSLLWCFLSFPPILPVAWKCVFHLTLGCALHKCRWNLLPLNDPLMERCALEPGTLWGAATVDENFASINPSSPITCLSRWSKNPFGEAKWAFYVHPPRLKGHVLWRAHKQQHHKWEVSVSLRALTLISRQRATLPPFSFYQDHLRIDRVLASRWLGPQKQNQFGGFIYLFPSQYLLH